MSWLLTLIKTRACSRTGKNVNATGECCTNVTAGSAWQDQLPQRGNTPQIPRTILNYSTQKHMIVLTFIFITQRNGSSCCSSICPARGKESQLFHFYKTTKPSVAKKAAHRSRVCAIKQFGHNILYQIMCGLECTSPPSNWAMPSLRTQLTVQHNFLGDTKKNNNKKFTKSTKRIVGCFCVKSTFSPVNMMFSLTAICPLRWVSFWL